MGFKFNALTGSLDIDTKTSNAKSIQGVSVSSATPSDNQIIIYDSSTETWELEDLDLSSYVIGPLSSTDNAIARFDGTTGDIQGYTSNAPVISDSGIASFPEDDFIECERIGSASEVTGASGTAFGFSSRAHTRGVAIGRGANTGPFDDCFCVGYNAQTQNIRAFAFGTNAIANNSALALGFGANALGIVSTAIGRLSNCSSVSTSSIAIGNNPQVSASRGIAIGELAKVLAGANDGIAIGPRAEAQHANSIVIGLNTSSEANQITIGSSTARQYIRQFGGEQKPVETITSNTTLNGTHWTVLVDTTSGDVTITLPINVDGRVYNIKKISSDANQVILSGTIDGGSVNLTTQYESITIQNQTSNWWVL